MDNSPNMEESEIILLQLVGKLTEQTPQIILKNIGVIGAERLFVQYVNDADEKKQLVQLRNGIAKICQEYGHSKYALKLTELAELRIKMANMEGLANPPADEKLMIFLGHMFTLLIGFIFGISFTFG